MHTKLLCLLLPALLLTGCAEKPAEAQSKDIFAMDTYMSVRVWSSDPSLPDRAEAEISRLEALFSVTAPDSDTVRINSAHGTPVTVSPETAEVIRKGNEIGSVSGGALNIALYPVSKLWGFTQKDPHVPDPDAIAAALPRVRQAEIRLSGTEVTVPDGTELDLGAVAKGYTGDRLTALFRESGAKSAIISLGGNVQTLGTKPDGSLWTVGIADPFTQGETICTIRTGEGAVITSGNYERYFEEDGRRYHHILDPATGYPAENGLVSVSVIGASGLECDALSTALFVMGKERAIDCWRSRGGFGMILITDEPALYYTEDLDIGNLPDLRTEVIRHAE